MRPIALREDAPIEHQLLRPFHRFRGPRIVGPVCAVQGLLGRLTSVPIAPCRLRGRLHRLAFIAWLLPPSSIPPPANSVLHRCPLRSFTFQDCCRCRGVIAAAFYPPATLPFHRRSAAIAAPRPSRCHLRPPRSSALRDRRRPLPPSAAIFGVASVSDNAPASLPISPPPGRWRQLWPRA
jgi:hypothetical protein